MHGPVLALIALALAKPVGTELWRVALDAPLLAQPAVSESGDIALLTRAGVALVDSSGVTKATVADVRVPFQPFWQGDRVWLRAQDGWRTWGRDGVAGRACDVNAQSGAVDDRGRVLFAPPEEIVECAAGGAHVLTRRRGGLAQLFSYPGGYVTGDEWFVESFDRELRSIGARVTTEVGYPGAVSLAGTILVTTPAGRIDALDRFGTLLWHGPPGAGGSCILMRGGSILMPGDRELSVVDPPWTLWSMPVPAGVRAALAFEEGSVALVDRLGRVGVAREGRLQWSRLLKEPGNILAPFADGVLVQDGTDVVAIAAWRADGGDPTRDQRTRSAPMRRRCPPAPHTPLERHRLHLDGPAFFDGDSCTYPSVELEASADRGRVKWRVPCGSDCSAAPTPDGGLVRTDHARLVRTDAAGNGARVLATKLAPGAQVAVSGPWIGVRSGTDLLWLDSKGRQKKKRTLERAWTGGIAFDGESIAGVSDDRLVLMPMDGSPTRLALGKGEAGPLRVFRFGSMPCALGSGVAGCELGGRLAQLSVEPRSAWWGESIVRCAPESLCHRSAGAPDERFFKASAAIDQFEREGELVVVLVAGREVDAVSPDGEVQWRATFKAEGACAADRWLARTPKGDVLARGCDAVVAITP